MPGWDMGGGGRAVMKGNTFSVILRDYLCKSPSSQDLATFPVVVGQFWAGVGRRGRGWPEGGGGEQRRFHHTMLRRAFPDLGDVDNRLILRNEFEEKNLNLKPAIASGIFLCFF